jgi:NAD(P)-dependent dehydrogenase (short-subunit alcohol dehydrogenase family)
VAEKCRQLSNQKVLEVVADMTKDEDIKRLLNETINAFGKLDVLVNNAGVFMFTPVTDPNIMKNYETIMSTNVKGVLLLSTLAVPYLEKTKGNIINVSSIAGMRPVSSFSPF